MKTGVEESPNDNLRAVACLKGKVGFSECSHVGQGYAASINGVRREIAPQATILITIRLDVKYESVSDRRSGFYWFCCDLLRSNHIH